MLTTEEIRQFMEEDNVSQKKQFARKGQEYYDGDHDIRHYRMFYYNEDGNLVEDKTRSNAKISHPFFTELVDQAVQYILSGADGFVKTDEPVRDSNLAPKKEIHKTYSILLSMLTLSEKHQKDLMARGLTL